MTTTSSQSIRPQFRTIDGLAIRYAESDPRPDDALLLNPWPESLYAYEPAWSRLAAQAHLVAIDMPGFGHSERRESLMSPRAMSEFVVRVADASAWNDRTSSAWTSAVTRHCSPRRTIRPGS